MARAYATDEALARLSPGQRRYSLKLRRVRRMRASRAVHRDGADCPCGSCAAKRAHAAGRYAHRRQPRAWLPAEEAVLRRLAGTRRVAEIAAALERECGRGRTVGAVRQRLFVLECGVATNDLTADAVRRLLRVNPRKVLDWLRTGTLVGTRQGAKGAWRITPAALERFLLDYPAAYDWRRIQHPRWRAIAARAPLRSATLTRS